MFVNEPKKVLLALTVLWLVTAAGCPLDQNHHTLKKRTEAASPREGIKYHHYEDPSGEVFAFIYQPGFKPEPSKEDEVYEEHYLPDDSSIITEVPGAINDEDENPFVNCLASIPTGKKLIEYEIKYGMLDFSDNGTFALLQYLPEGNVAGEITLELARTKDNSILWQRDPNPREGYGVPLKVVWDLDRGFLILAVYPIPDPPIDTKSIDTINLQVYRISDGEFLGEKLIYLDFMVTSESILGIRYGGGKVFFPAMSDPVSEWVNETDTYDIYSVEMLTWKSERIDMQGLLGNPPHEFFASEDGDRLFFRTNEGYPENRLALIGNDIIEIDLVSGEWRTLLMKGEGIVYSLQGITPNGDRICCVEITQDEDMKITRTPVVYEVSTGILKRYSPWFTTGTIPSYAISACGKYVIEYTIGADIFIHHLEDMTSTMLISATDYPRLFALPGIPGPYNK